MMPNSALSLLALLTATQLNYANALTFDCNQVVLGDNKFDFSKLGGPHSAFMLQRTPTAIKNTTFTIDICKPLYKSGDKPKTAECPNGSRVCALERFYHPDVMEEPLPEDVWPIAGNFVHEGSSGELNPHYTLLRDSASHTDADREGVRVELNGGKHEGVRQKAIIEFVCDHEKTGMEGLHEETTTAKRRRQEDGGDGGGDGGEEEPALPDPNAGRSLQLRNYRLETVGGSGGNDATAMGVLRLEWFTKYACERSSTPDKDNDDVGGDPGKSTKGWGFFTWFIIIIFLGIAAYLIFGSWLNYSRYGARGWDLLPHGDTIRDLPYLMKDWARRVVGTVQSGSGRGYSAI